MKCNMCGQGEMIHQMVIRSKTTQEVTVLSPETEAYGDVSLHVAMVNSQKTADGHHITHIYNCEECPNSQLEYYIPENAVDYEKAMNRQRIY